MKMRLAMREEGTLWNAYVAEEGTMTGAVLIGSIAMGAVKRDESLRRRFLALMRDAFHEAIKGVTGSEVQWNDPVRAPEHERAGHS